MLDRLLKLSAVFPLWLFVLRLAAYLSNIILLVFATFLLVAGWSTPLILGYSLLLALFSTTNMRAITQSKHVDSSNRAVQKTKTLAHLASTALPLAYVAGALNSSMSGALEFNNTLAVIVPPLLNWLAIEETLRFNGRTFAGNKTS